ncbi:PREDICTED: alpha-amylase 2-like, partial [Wasmannia auropunctata]|uniref:alpha-amylase 2-like n=1 Tax=Wasmannia auropunctata TaxID=64793 RepID=UPI0005F090CF
RRRHTRSGTADEFKEMVRRCNNAGVRIYVDVVFNHMSGDHRDAKGTGGSTANTYDFSYPAVPFSREHFHPSCSINNYQDPKNVRNCELSGLHDLDQSNEHVREKIVEFLNAAIDIGVAGFRLAESLRSMQFSCNISQSIFREKAELDVALTLPISIKAKNF